VLVVRPVSDELVARLARHPVSECAERAPSEGHIGGVEEAGRRERSAEDLLDEREGSRTLHLVAEQLGVVGAGREVGAGRPLHVVAPLPRVEAQPALRRRDPGQEKGLGCRAEEDPVGHDEALGRHGRILLGLADREVSQIVDSEIGEQSQRVGTCELRVGHVERQIAQRDRLVPGGLLGAPSAVLARHAERHPGLAAVAPEEPDRTAGGLDGILDTLGHGSSSSSSEGANCL